MFLILKDTDWKEEDYIKHSKVPFGWMEEEDYIKHNIVPFGWIEDNNRAIPSKDEIFAKVQTEEQRNFLLKKLNNKYTKHLNSEDDSPNDWANIVQCIVQGKDKVIQELEKENAELKGQVENRNCSNCRRSRAIL